MIITTEKINEFINYLKLRNLSKTTITYYKSILGLFNNSQTINDCIKIIINDEYKAGSQNIYKAVLVSYLKFFELTKEIKTLSLIKHKKQDMTYMKVLTKEEIYQKCQQRQKEDELIKGAKTVIKFLFETGIRVHEIETLEKQNNRLYVKGKGNKKRQIFYLEKTLEALEQLYPNLEIKLNYMKILRYIKKTFGDDVSYHTFRRSFATYMLKSGSNVKSVMLQMGHKDIQTTYRYINLDEEYNKNNYMKFFGE